MRQIVLDTETTGLSAKDGHRIIEIGCIEMVDRRFTGKTYHQYINPEREVDAGAQAVHGISNDFLKDKPVFSAIAEDFFAFCDGGELIIHNASFDIGFINAELEWLKFHCTDITERCQVLDTLMLARKKHPGQANNLDALCRRYSVDASSREFHGALLDSELLAQVYLSMTSEQGSLFGGAQEKPAQQQAGDVKVAAQPRQSKSYDLPVIQADETEQAAHQAFVEKVLAD
jgi:DNA polymerase-3 subunit epsilon